MRHRPFSICETKVNSAPTFSASSRWDSPRLSRSSRSQRPALARSSWVDVSDCWWVGAYILSPPIVGAPITDDILLYTLVARSAGNTENARSDGAPKPQSRGQWNRKSSAPRLASVKFVKTMLLAPLSIWTSTPTWWLAAWTAAKLAKIAVETSMMSWLPAASPNWAIVSTPKPALNTKLAVPALPVMGSLA